MPQEWAVNVVWVVVKRMPTPNSPRYEFIKVFKRKWHAEQFIQEAEANDWSGYEIRREELG